MTEDEAAAALREASAEGWRRVARADEAMRLARGARDILARDVAVRMTDGALSQARAANRYSAARAAFEYAQAVHTSALSEARRHDVALARSRAQPE